MPSRRARRVHWLLSRSVLWWTPVMAAVPVVPVAEDPRPDPLPTVLDNCRDSHNPLCGEFRWDPEPVNDPMAVDVAVANSFREIDGERHSCASADKGRPCPGQDPYGPRTPPPKDPDRYEATFTEVFETPGQHQATVGYGSQPSGGCPPRNPYQSKGQGSVRFTLP